MKALLGFLIACVALGSAHASPLRMHGLPVGSGPAPDLIVQMLPTQTAILDLTSVTTHCNNTEFLSVTPVGTGASFEVDRGQSLIASTTETWRKSELVNNTGYSADSDHQALNLVHTDSTAVGTGAATLNILCRSSGLTKVVRIDVVAGPSFDWNYGVETSVRYGGLNMARFGTPTSRYTVDTGTNSCGTGVACSSIFEIWENHLMIKCIGNTTQCPPSGSGTAVFSAGGTNAIAPTAGTSQDVLIDDSMGSSFSVHMHWTAHQRDIAVSPTGGSWVPLNGVQGQLCLTTKLNMHYGDTVMLEGERDLRSTFGPWFYNFNACQLGTPRSGTLTQYTTPTTGPVPEFAVSGFTCTVAANHCFSRPYSPSFVTYTCREVFECDVGFMWDVGLWNKPINARFWGMNSRNAANGIYPYAFSPSVTINFQIDHMKAQTITTFRIAGNGSYAYFLDNDVEGATSGGQFATCNSIIMGNRDLQSANSDAMHLGIQACNDGSEGDTYSAVKWNWVSGLWLNAFTHLDFMQGDWSVSSGAGGLKVPLGDNHVYSVIGNILMGPPPHIYDCGDVYASGTHGTFSPASCSGNTGFSDLTFTASNCPNGVCANGTYRSEDGQCFLMHDGSQDGATINYQVYGNYCASAFGQGINMTTAGPGSVVSYNAFMFSNLLTNLNLLPGSFNSPTIINFAPGAIFTADGNVVTNNLISWVDAGNFPAPGPVAPLVSNLDQSNGCSSAATCFPNSASGLSPWLNNYTTRMQPSLDVFALGGAAVGHGPAQVVDIRGRKVTNTAAVSPHPGIPLTLPYCTVAPTLSNNSGGANQAAGFTASITGSVLNVTAMTSGSNPIVPGANTQLNGAGISAGVLISSFGTGSGGTGTYNLSASSPVGSEGMTATDTRMVSGITFTTAPSVTWTQTPGTLQSGWQIVYQAGNAFQSQFRGPVFTTSTPYPLTPTDLGIVHDPGTNIFISYVEYTGLTTAGSNLCQSNSFAYQ